MTTTQTAELATLSEYKYGFRDDVNYVFQTRKGGLDVGVVTEISAMKGEPQWMLDFRLKALDIFNKKPMPTWGGEINLDFDQITFYTRPSEKTEASWDDVPADIKNTFDKLGIPEAERKFLAGVGAQYECLSEDTRVYTARGVISIRDVQPGDTVFSLDEQTRELRPCLVKATACKGERPVFEVRAGTRTIKATENHPFLVLDYQRKPGRQRGRYRATWKYLRDLKEGDLVAVAKSLPDVGQGYTLKQPAIKTTVTGRNQSVEYPTVGSTIVARYLETNGFAGNAHEYSSAAGTQFRGHTSDSLGFVRIQAITSAGTAPVYDIEVDGPHNFVAEGLIVHNSEMVYHSVQKHLEEMGVIFLSSDDGLRQHPDIFREHFSKVIPPADNKFAACNSAVWSGGSFVYVPKGVKVEMPLQAYFRLNAEGTGQFERTLIIVDEGAQVHYVEGCHLAGARVRTRTGEKPIEEIRAGDEVWTHTGRYRRVYNTMSRPYRGPIYHIRVFGDSGHELHVTHEHPLLVLPREQADARDPNWKPKWLPASQVQSGDYLVVPVPQSKMTSERSHTVVIPIGHGRHEPVMREVQLPNEPDFFRLLGYYHAEGHVDNEHYLSFSFNVNETDYLDDTRSLIGRYFGKTPIENKPRQGGQTLVLCSTEAARTFARTFGSTVYEKRVPDFIRNASLDLLTQWVRGMWRGDGSYDEEHNTFRYSTVSPELAYAFRDVLLRLGVIASVNLQERTWPRQPMYTVLVSRPRNALFGEIVGHPAPNGREGHSSSFHLDEKYMYVPIRAIEIEEANAPVYNFSVEEDESYICEGVVSHNCTAPTYSRDSFHSGVIEIIVKKGARMRYTTIQNWSTNVYNLVTQRAVVHEGATMEWVDANLGCLAEGMTVVTPDGVKPIEAVEVGEEVLAFDETTGEMCFRAVSAKRFSGYQHVREVAWGERRIWVTDNHPFYSYDYDPTAPKKMGRYRLGYVRADQLTEAIVPRASLDYGQPYTLAQPSTTTAFKSNNQYAKFEAVRDREQRLAYLSENFRNKAQAVRPPKTVFWRKVGRSNIELPEALEIVPVSVGDPSSEKMPTWDIEVEGTGNFVAEGFVVHNSKLTMKYPSCYLVGEGAHGEILSMAFAGPGQHQDTGGKVVHSAPHTTSKITSKSISMGGGRASYRGLLKVYKGAHGSKSNVVCDALLLDPQSRSDTYPYIEIDEDDVTIGHEASVSKVGEDQLFYLMSRGLTEDEASTMVVSGFIEPMVKELPLEYAIEMNRLLQLRMEGSVG